MAAEGLAKLSVRAACGGDAAMEAGEQLQVLGRPRRRYPPPPPLSPAGRTRAGPQPCGSRVSYGHNHALCGSSHGCDHFDLKLSGTEKLWSLHGRMWPPALNCLAKPRSHTTLASLHLEGFFKTTWDWMVLVGRNILKRWQWLLSAIRGQKRHGFNVAESVRQLKSAP